MSPEIPGGDAPDKPKVKVEIGEPIIEKADEPAVHVEVGEPVIGADQPKVALEIGEVQIENPVKEAKETGEKAVSQMTLPPMEITVSKKAEVAEAPEAGSEEEKPTA
jgi:hypothetical protein